MASQSEQILLDIQNSTSKQHQDDIKQISKEIVEVENKLIKVQDKWLDGVINDDAFNSMNSQLMSRKSDLEIRLAERKELPSAKEQAEKLKYALAFIENMGSCLSTAPISLKINILGSIFTGKIVFENEKPRTENLSPLLSLITGKTSSYDGGKKKKPSNDIESFSRGG